MALEKVVYGGKEPFAEKVGRVPRYLLYGLLFGLVFSVINLPLVILVGSLTSEFSFLRWVGSDDTSRVLKN